MEPPLHISLHIPFHIPLHVRSTPHLSLDIQVVLLSSLLLLPLDLLLCPAHPGYVISDGRRNNLHESQHKGIFLLSCIISEDLLEKGLHLFGVALTQQLIVKSYSRQYLDEHPHI